MEKILADCTLNLNGDRHNVAVLQRRTVPELQLLAAMHGPDAVENIAVVERIPHGLDTREEKERLREAYPTSRKVIEDLFPGVAPNMPITLQSAGLDAYVIDDGEASTAGPKSKAKKAPSKSKLAAAAKQAEAPKDATKDERADDFLEG